MPKIKDGGFLLNESELNPYAADRPVLEDLVNDNKDQKNEFEKDVKI